MLLAGFGWRRWRGWRGLDGRRKVEKGEGTEDDRIERRKTGDCERRTRAREEIEKIYFRFVEKRMRRRSLQVE